MSTKKTSSEKIMELINQYKDDDISDMANAYALEHAITEEEQQGMYAGFIAGFKEAYGMGVQDGANIDWDD